MRPSGHSSTGSFGAKLLTYTLGRGHIMKLFTKFANDESGAVTVDWVVLTAAIVGIAIAVISLISGGIEDASNGINDELGNASAVTF